MLCSGMCMEVPLECNLIVVPDLFLNVSFVSGPIKHNPSGGGACAPSRRTSAANMDREAPSKMIRTPCETRCWGHGVLEADEERHEIGVREEERNCEGR